MLFIDSQSIRIEMLPNPKERSGGADHYRQTVTLPTGWLLQTNRCPDVPHRASEKSDHSRFMVTDATEKSCRRGVVKVRTIF